MQKLNEVSVPRADLELALVYGNTTQESCDALDRLRAAVDAPIEPVEPVAWMYEHDGLVHNEQFKPLFYVNRQVGVQEPWNETPLYAKQTAQAVDSAAAALLRELLVGEPEAYYNVFYPDSRAKDAPRMDEWLDRARAVVGE